MQIVTAKITGNAEGGFWAQVQSFKDDSNPNLGELTIALSLACNFKDAQSAQKGKEILQLIKQLYFTKRQNSSVHQKLLHVVQSVKNKYSTLNIDLIACVFVSGFAYFTLNGKGKVFLARQKKLYKLTNKERTSLSLSGRVQKDDFFLFGTEHFFKNINQELLQDLISTSNQPRDIADSLTPIIHNGANPQAAAIILAVTDLENVKISPLASPKPTGETGSTIKKTISLKNRLKALAQNLILKIVLKLPEKNIQIKINPASHRRHAVSIGIILLILLILSIVFGFKQKRILEQKSLFQPQLKQAVNLLTEALSQEKTDPALAKELFSQAQEITQTLLSEGVKDKELDELAGKLTSLAPSILGRLQRQASIFLDLSILRSESSATKLTLEDQTLAVLDQGGGRVITIAVDGRKTQVLGPHEKTKGAFDLTQYGSRTFIITDEGVVEVTKTDTKKVIDKDRGLEDISAATSFSGNLYTLNKKGEIWRYPAVEGGLFGAGKNWFGPDLALAADSNDISIDGSVWILLQNGNIKKFTRGSPENFKVKGLESTLPHSRAIYTDENLESIYLLDPQEKRILEIAKNGDFQKEYMVEEAQNALDFVVSKKEGKIFLLTQTKIYQVDL